MNIDPPQSVIELVKDNPRADSYWKRWLNFVYEELQVEDWHNIGDTDEPAFTGTINWANRGTGDDPDAGFYKDPFDRVFVRGVINTGTNGESAWTFPEGYRPDTEIVMSVRQTASAAGAYVVIGTDGTMIVNHSDATGSKDIWLNNISFRVA